MRNAGDDPYAFIYFVKCKRCGAITRVRIDKRNDISRDDNDNLFVRKGIVDSKCYAPIEIVIQFNEGHKESSREISGGEFVTADEYERSTHRIKNG
jgi:hypothetical protein